ncbi:hypothetical protein CC86DRAFT_46128 [Ophiobolus disseminans]|uniref:Uncharacterized protein n=1 Tax=Ophiobolus disseminans TaxID=1469910 RepID=A0A6A6ZV65_9PLEO|nr:hypothetical protein CC86DRAFT_46128 [Ophiobolus disseminans]
MDTRISPFLRGWRSLPDELKVAIIAYALPSGLFVSHEFIRRNLKINFLTRLEHWEIPIQSLLACPETARFILPTLY